MASIDISDRLQSGIETSLLARDEFHTSRAMNGVENRLSGLKGVKKGSHTIEPENCDHMNGDDRSVFWHTGQNDGMNLVEPVAICGIAMRLPGGVHDAESFWNLLYNKRNGQCVVPKSRYNVDAFYGPGKLGHVTSKLGYFLEDVDLATADTSFWTMTRQEIESMDPQQRLVLEIVYECLQTAGQIPSQLKGRKIGVYLGTFEGDWLELDGRDIQGSHIYRLTGYGDYMHANRAHYEFGFTGPR